ncbi:zn 2cys6 transcription factor [Diplodia corticola]|uniref:Zn 2cys6 transcription factor n=1 Tax=Diplodia corticola TaxID=236234 RepID=A0A1J9RHX1_9PEZI|nr:zn 2cys6 transcription factor [Diplodia corticola]OJD40232.1 zn 2cys6 transcription factor [Diplodia corticola]
MPDAEERRARRARTRKPRGRGLRTRTGCITCRKRHVKCDEANVPCGPCAKRGHECVYGEPTPLQPRKGSQPSPVDANQPILRTEAAPENTCCDFPFPDFPQPGVDDGVNIGESPGSSVGSARPAVSTATAGWFGLLLDDAALELEGNSSQTVPLLDPELFGNDANTLSQQLPILSPSRQNALTEHRPWRCSEQIQLSPNECLLFDNFVRRVGRWLDLFDQEDHFSTLVPRLAMYNIGLMNAILALSVRHISLNPHVAPDVHHERAVALKYYYETLHYLHKAMQFDCFKTSLELLATSLIVSTYEMLDGSRPDWERHLKGVFWIQRSQIIHGDSGGLKQANWWAWLCQDVWAAFREKRKVFSFWKHPRTFDQLNEHELACRAVYTFAKAVNFCSKEETETEQDSVHGKIAKADALVRMLDEWQSLLTLKFSPLPTASGTESDVFPSIWIYPSCFAVAVQLNNAARILIDLHRPFLGGLSGYVHKQKEMMKCAETICGIARPLTDDAASLMSSQCLYIAGLVVQDTKQQEAILDLINECRLRTGWPIKPLGEELQALWSMP